MPIKYESNNNTKDCIWSIRTNSYLNFVLTITDLRRKDDEKYMKKAVGLFPQVLILILLGMLIFSPSFIIDGSQPYIYSPWFEGTLVMAEYSDSSLHLDNLMSRLSLSRPNEIMHAKSFLKSIKYFTNAKYYYFQTSN